MGDLGRSGAEPRLGKRLGVVGTMVWDTIHSRDGREAPVEEWGGIGYALEALGAALPSNWEIRPLLKVGRDLSEAAFHFFRRIPRVRAEESVQVVPEPNNRVELRYEDQNRRCERLTGGVPPWTWIELAPLARECDALYVNFISGFEMDLDAARALRHGFQGPTYADLHSLFLALGHEGVRVPRLLPGWGDWLRCFDAVQMNEAEFELLGRAGRSPWEIAAEAIGPDLKLITVTLGARGAAYICGSALTADPGAWPSLRGRVAYPGPGVSGLVPLDEPATGGDPTGCGDVWGATFFARLLAGKTLEEAMDTANRFAARNVQHRGASGLRLHLLGQIADRPSMPSEESPPARARRPQGGGST
jgi:hypothetical protein